ncbi:Serine/threonine-protein kinase 16 [Lobulomyces angularis]|nr:Serine/threonine-protein kinase 16 [Lobulomyces angularis]
MEPSTSNRLGSYCYFFADTVKSLLTSCSPTETLIINNKKYKVIKCLGEGGFSYVYLVIEPTTNARFALKRIKVQLPEHEERLISEVKNHSKVESKYVLKLVDSMLLKDNFNQKIIEGFLILPFYKNGTCQNLIENLGDGEYLPIGKILELTLDIIKGLETFHENNLAFRDLKPANVLLTDEGQGVLMDLGSVADFYCKINSRKEASALAELCAETCTAPFRAPELFDPTSSGVITGVSDIWSLGCTIFALAYRNSPYDGSATAAIGGRISYPTERDIYGTKFREYVESILVTDPSSRPSASQVRRTTEMYLNSLNS